MAKNTAETASNPTSAAQENPAPNPAPQEKTPAAAPLSPEAEAVAAALARMGATPQREGDAALSAEAVVKQVEAAKRSGKTAAKTISGSRDEIVTTLPDGTIITTYLA